MHAALNAALKLAPKNLSISIIPGAWYAPTSASLAGASPAEALRSTRRRRYTTSG